MMGDRFSGLCVFHVETRPACGAHAWLHFRMDAFYCAWNLSSRCWSVMFHTGLT